MNLFILHTDPVIAAKYYCDLHVPKLVVECYQMLGSAVRRHGATDEQMPLTATTKRPLRGGYHNHPATRFVGNTRDNYQWTVEHALALCSEFQKRFGKIHACEAGIRHLKDMDSLIPEGGLTEFALCMPDEYKVKGDAVASYRSYYLNDKIRFAEWNRGRSAPHWWVAA